jgi:hypothetical protein
VSDVREITAAVIMPGKRPADYRDAMPEVWRGGDDGEGGMSEDVPDIEDMRLVANAIDYASKVTGVPRSAVGAFELVKASQQARMDGADVLAGLLEELAEIEKGKHSQA